MKKHKVMLHTLHISPGQRCNLKCPICQCGESSNAEITEEVASMTFADVKHVNQLSFIDGEVNLMPRAVNILNAALQKHGVSYQDFSGFLNGTCCNDECMDALFDIACRSKSADKFGRWRVSFDEWHLGEGLRVMGEQRYAATLQKLLTHPLVNMHTSSNALILNAGRAKTTAESYGLNRAEYNPDFYLPHCFVDKENDKIIASTVMVNCFGDAVAESEHSGCGASAYGNVVRDGGVANILLNSDKVTRYNSFAEYADGYNKVYDEEMARLEAARPPQGCEKKRELKLMRRLSAMTGLGL